MSSLFSLESSIEKIYNESTKEYFKEVYLDYVNGCYRSATVALWTVIIYDIILKLHDLKDIYNDNTASEILKHIEKKNHDNPYDASWEKDLIDKVTERTELLDTSTHHFLITIQKNRHLSAHPVIDKQHTIFIPTQDSVRNDIRNSIEAILSKPAFLGKNILCLLLADLKKIKDIMFSDIELERYLRSKYLNALNEKTQTKLFKDLWKIVFKDTSDDASNNREINFRTLMLIYKNFPSICNSAISSNIPHFSNIEFETPNITKLLIEFISTKKEIYDAFTDATKEVIKAKSRDCFYLHSISFFLANTIQEHLNDIISFISFNMHSYQLKLSNDETQTLYDICEKEEIFENFYSLCILIYINSDGYDQADQNYNNFIYHYYDKFTKENFINLFNGANNNSQVNDRRKSSRNDRELLIKAKEKYPDIDLTKYTNLPINDI